MAVYEHLINKKTFLDPHIPLAKLDQLDKKTLQTNLRKRTLRFHWGKNESFILNYPQS